MAYMLTAGAGQYASASDAAVLDVTGDIDIRWRGALTDWQSGAFQTMFAKWSTVGNQRSWRFTMTSADTMRFDWSPDGTDASVQSRVLSPGTLTDAQRYWWRVTLDVDNGAGGFDLKLWGADEALPSPVAADFSQVGSTTTGGAPTSIFASTTAVTVGADGAAGDAAAGKYDRAQIYDGIDGTLVFDADFSDPSTWVFS